MELLQKPVEPIPASFADAYRRFQPYPHDAAPEELFITALNYCSAPTLRYISMQDERQTNMFCDACLNNSQVYARGGCAVMLSPPDSENPEPDAITEVPLKIDGARHTNNRAELYSVTVGLRLRYWRSEGFERIVLAMNSEYVVLGISERINKWISRGWRTAAGTPVANRDLWEELLEKLREMEKGGMHVQFWLIPKEWDYSAIMLSWRHQ